MERKIGEIFEYNGEWYQCIIGHCNQCCFDGAGTCKFNGDPYCSYRSDKKNVIFKKLEKVGVPYHNSEKKLCQQYKCYINPLVTDEIVYVFADNRVVIEIKQNKEDMEGKTNLYEKQTPLQKLMEIYCDGRMDYNEFEKKVKELYSDKGDDSKPILKPFDLEAAKAGKPVCTRDGRKARIICFDRVNAKPILALVASTDGKGEDVFDYFVSGKRIANALESNLALMMLSEKRSGWVNIDKGGSGKITVSSPYSTKEEAIHNDNETTIDTIKISWEE